MAADKGEAQAHDASRPSLKKRLFLPGIIGGIMLVEAVAMFVVVRAFGPKPAPVHAAEEPPNPQEQIDALDAEVAVAQCDAINRTSGQAVVVHLVISALVSPENTERMGKLMEKRRDTVQDRIQFVVRGADPKHLNEPGLETLRRDIKAELGKVLGDDELIVDLLIPQILQTRSNL